MTDLSLPASTWQQPRCVSRSEFIEVRGVRYHLRRWGNPDAPLVLLLHGWMDFSGTFQFMVDACEQEWNFVSLDWCGYGLTERRSAYNFFDYVADLDVIVNALSPKAPVRIVAHSMGANTAMLWAAARPNRLRALVNMEGLAPVPVFDDRAPGERIARWIDGQSTGHQAPLYSTPQEFAGRLRKANPLLPEACSEFLASEFLQRREDGRYRIAADPRARAVVPAYPDHGQIVDIWGEIRAPVLFLIGDQSFIHEAFRERQEELDARIRSVVGAQRGLITGASHNMHHERAESVAQAAEAFLTSFRKD